MAHPPSSFLWFTPLNDSGKGMTASSAAGAGAGTAAPIITPDLKILQFFPADRGQVIADEHVQALWKHLGPANKTATKPLMNDVSVKVCPCTIDPLNICSDPRAASASHANSKSYMDAESSSVADVGIDKLIGQ